MFAEFITRLIRDESKIQIYEKELQLLENVTNHRAKQYLVKRKTKLILLICVYSISLITELVKLVEFSYVDKNIERNIRIVSAFDHMLHYLVLCILGYQLYYWNEYSKSINGSIMIIYYLLIIQNILLWIPYYKLLGGVNSKNTIIMLNFILAIARNCFISIYLFRLINKTIANILIKFPNLPEFHVIDAILTLITIPFVTYSMLVVFQITSEPIIPFIWILLLLSAYSKYISSNKVCIYRVIYYSLLLAIIIYCIVVWNKYIINILNKIIHDIPNIITQLVNNILTTIIDIYIMALIIDDMLIYALNYLKKENTNRVYSEFIYELNGIDRESLIQLR